MLGGFAFGPTQSCANEPSFSPCGEGPSCERFSHPQRYTPTPSTCCFWADERLPVAFDDATRLQTAQGPAMTLEAPEAPERSQTGTFTRNGCRGKVPGRADEALTCRVMTQVSDTPAPLLASCAALVVQQRLVAYPHNYSFIFRKQNRP